MPDPPAMEALAIVGLGFFLGMRHATDPDHVIAITTIIGKRRELSRAAIAGVLWGVGHTLTVMAVGTLIILFNVTIPEPVGLGMELSVGAMLVVLGLVNIAGFLDYRPAAWRWLAAESREVHSHAHSHGDYVHTHPHGHAPEVHPHAPDRTPVAALDRRFGRWAIYGWARPVVIGVVHGLAGSAAVALLVLAAVRDPAWAMAYLLVFGLGTIVGMTLVTLSIGTAIRLAGGRSETLSRRFGLASGVASVLFGVFYAWSLVRG